jgi:type I restriction enzyme S subunit
MKDLVLGESLEVLIDHRGKTPGKLGDDFVESGVPVASAILVKDGRLDLTAARYVSDALFRRWMPVPTKAGDVLLTSEAPLGRVARVGTDEPLVLGQRLFGLRGRRDVLDSGYLYYALQTEWVQSDLVGRSTGTTVTGIRQSALRAVRIPAPSYLAQAAIAETLGALDSQIVMCNDVIVAAEALMVAISEAVRTMTTIADIALFEPRAQSPTEFDETVAHFSLPAFDGGATPQRVKRAEIKSNKLVIDKPVVLVSKLNPRIPRIWNVSRLSEEMAVASTEFVLLAPTNVSTSALWSVLSQPSVSTQLASKVSGTSGSHQRVKPAEVLALSIPDPRHLKPDHRAAVDALGELAHVRRLEREHLAATRDELLPLLMSGKIRVQDADRQIEDVL